MIIKYRLQEEKKIVSKKKIAKIAEVVLAIIMVVTMFGAGSFNVKAAVEGDPDFYISPALGDGGTLPGKIDLIDLNGEGSQSGISSGSLPSGKWICVEGSFSVDFRGDLSYAQDVVYGSETCYRFTSDVKFEVSGTTVTFIGSETSSSKKSSEKKHEHNYKWEVVREATESTPGERVYKCDCGNIAQRDVIPVETKIMERINNSLDVQVKSVPQGGKVTLELGDWNSLQNKFMKKIQNSGATVTLKYNYNKKKYTIIIPADGFKDMGIEWYGPAFLYSIYGGTIED